MNPFTKYKSTGFSVLPNVRLNDSVETYILLVINILQLCF